VKYVIIRTLNDFLMTETDDTELDACMYVCMYVCNVRKLHRPRMSDAFSTDNVNTTFCLYGIVAQQLPR